MDQVLWSSYQIISSTPGVLNVEMPASTMLPITATLLAQTHSIRSATHGLTPAAFFQTSQRPYSDFLNAIGAVTQIDVASVLGGACLNPDVRK